MMMRCVRGSILKSDIHVVAALHPLCLRADILRQYTHKTLLLIIPVVNRLYLFIGDILFQRRIGRHQNAAVHRYQVRCKIQPYRTCPPHRRAAPRSPAYADASATPYAFIFSLTSQKRLSVFAPRPAPDVPDFASIIIVSGSISCSFTSG